MATYTTQPVNSGNGYTTGTSDLWGVNTTQPYSKETSKGYVLEGITDYLNPQLQKARGSLSSRGFGRYSAPTLEANVYKPYLSAGAESVRNALTDLYFKDEQLAIQKKDQQLREEQLRLEKIKTNQYYDLTEQQMKTERKKQSSGGSVICTAMHDLGFISDEHMEIDNYYGEFCVDREIKENYWLWAVSVADFIRKHKWFAYVIFPIFWCWGRYMKSVVYCYRPPLSGLIIHKIGLFIGKCFRKRYQLKGAI